MRVGNLYDVIIVGGGPIGLACGLAAKKQNLNYLILEKGCLVNSIYNYPAKMTFFSSAERLELAGIPFVSNNTKPLRVEALEYYRRVAQDNALNIRLFEEVENVSAIPNEQYEVISNKQQYTARNVIIATGFYDIPYLLNVPGETLPKVTHYYNEPHLYAFQKVLVVGAMNSAIDAALETWRKGAAVTLAIRQNEIGSRVKYWVKPDIDNRIAEGAIKAYFNTTVKEIKSQTVVLATAEGDVEIENDWVIAMTGYQPNLAFLKKIGVDLADDLVQTPLINETTHETNKRGVFLAGVICGGMNTHKLFIENSRVHADIIIKTIKNRIV